MVQLDCGMKETGESWGLHYTLLWWILSSNSSWHRFLCCFHSYPETSNPLKVFFYFPGKFVSNVVHSSTILKFHTWSSVPAGIRTTKCRLFSIFTLLECILELQPKGLSVMSLKVCKWTNEISKVVIVCSSCVNCLQWFNCSSYLVCIWQRSYHIFLAQVTQAFRVINLSLNILIH